MTTITGFVHSFGSSTFKEVYRLFFFLVFSHGLSLSHTHKHTNTHISFFLTFFSLGFFSFKSTETQEQDIMLEIMVEVCLLLQAFVFFKMVSICN